MKELDRAALGFAFIDRIRCGEALAAGRKNRIAERAALAAFAYIAGQDIFRAAQTMPDWGALAHLIFGLASNTEGLEQVLFLCMVKKRIYKTAEIRFAKAAAAVRRGFRSSRKTGFARAFPRRLALASPAAVGFALALSLVGPCTALFAAAAALSGPSEYLQSDLDSGVFYIPVAGDGDKQIIQTARKNGIKANRPFYEKYHAPLLAGVRSLAQQKNLTIADQVSLFGWLVIQTHNANNIGYLWGGDLLDGPSASGSTSGIGYDCSGYFWSVWEAIAPESVFANGGVRLDSRSYLNFGRCVIDSRKVDQSYIDDLIKKARPGDAIIDPNGHIMLYGYDPRTRDRTPIVMENGEFWNPLDKWLLRNKGKRLETRSTFAEDGSLLVKSGERKTPGRALPPMATPAREPSLVASASPGVGKPIARPGAGAMPEYESAPPEFVEDEIAALLLQLLSYEAFDTESLPPPSKANARPRIVAVRAPAAQLPNSALRFAVQAEDSDGDAIVQYRIRPRGTSQWILCDRAYFQTSMPGYAGPAMMEFQVMDARGAFSESTFRQIEVY